MSENSVYFLDACALIALVKKEEGAYAVAGLYKEAANGGARLLMNKMNLLEVYYGFHRECGKDYADTILRSVVDSVVSVTDTSYDVLVEAGRLKSNYRRISLADSIVLAETLVSGGMIVTADHHEMSVIEKNENISFLWIR
jgi:PIN domain nuclease of toxin-antitoxin system